MVRVLFVCLGNICRSPTAEGVFQHLVNHEGFDAHIEADSAGTHAYHLGKAPDDRSQACARRRGVMLEHLRARRVEGADFERFDYILAMDRENLADLEDRCPPQHKHKLALFLDYADSVRHAEVPDPYWGGPSGFDRVFDLVEEASRGLLEHIRANHLARSE